MNLEVLAPEDQGTWGDVSTLTYALVAFAGGLIATGLMHALLVSTPSPFSFFNWIMALVTVVAAVLRHHIGRTGRQDRDGDHQCADRHRDLDADRQHRRSITGADPLTGRSMRVQKFYRRSCNAGPAHRD